MIAGIISGRFSLFSPEIVKSFSKQAMIESVDLKRHNAIENALPAIRGAIHFGEAEPL